MPQCYGAAIESWLLPAECRVQRRASLPRSQRVICSLATGQHRQLLGVSAPTMAAYARLWGWDLVISTESLAPERPPSWNKLLLVQKLLERYRTVWWIDSDALFVTIGRDVTAELRPGRDLYLASHVQSDGHAALNVGVFVVRRSAWAQSFLRRAWAQRDLIQHNWWENAAILRLLGYSLEPPYDLERRSADLGHVGRLGDDWNHAVGSEAHSPVIHHHARGDHGDFGHRLESMAADLERFVDAHPDAFRPRWRQRLPFGVRRLGRWTGRYAQARVVKTEPEAKGPVTSR